MNDNINVNRPFKEAVCIDAMRVFDSCSSQDCLEDLAFTFDEAKEELTKIYGEPKKVDEAYIDFKAPPNTVRLSENDGKVSVVVY